jgi:hypothetical protein
MTPVGVDLTDVSVGLTPVGHDFVVSITGQSSGVAMGMG